MAIDITAEELLNEIRGKFPLEFEAASLQLTNRKLRHEVEMQQRLIMDLNRQLPVAAPPTVNPNGVDPEFWSAETEKHVRKEKE